MNRNTDNQALRRHWRRNRLLTGGLQLIWLITVLGTALFAREINRYSFFGMPLAFYIFAQGAPILFLVIIGIHARLMNRLDRHHARQCDAG
jgi:putative solute:sodium symporter small subunit